MLKILLVDDEHLSRDMLATYIEGLLGYTVVQAKSGEEAFEIYKNDEYPIVLSDIKMPGMNGLDLLRAVKSHPNGQKTKVVLFTGFAQVETAVQALRDGAHDYLFKPVDVNRLSDIIAECFAEYEKLPKETIEQIPVESKNHINKLLKNGSYIEIPDLGKIGVFSRKMKEIVEMCDKINQDRSLPVLIEGASGTGKEVIASIIHYGSNSEKLNPFVSINCAAISPSLFESELFGYEGGSFTGGKEEGKIGKLELAQGGTLLLDEIGEMPLEMQPKLLRVIQERCFYRVGGINKIDLDVRIIAATNRNLKQLAFDDKFRLDLFYRLNSASIFIPSLTEQKESIVPLAQMFLLEFAKKRNKKFRIISKDSADLLENHVWLGNVRELRNAIDRIVLLYDEIEVRPEHLNFLEFSTKNIFDDKMYVLKPGSYVLPEQRLDIQELEFEIVEKALDKFGGNKTQTAKYLGLTPSALRSRLR